MKKSFVLIATFFFAGIISSFGQAKDIFVFGMQYEYHPCFIIASSEGIPKNTDVHVGRGVIGWRHGFGNGRKHSLEWDLFSMSLSSYKNGGLGYSFSNFIYRYGRKRFKPTFSINPLTFQMDSKKAEHEKSLIIRSASAGFDFYIKDTSFIAFSIGINYGEIYGLTPYTSLGFKWEIF